MEALRYLAFNGYRDTLTWVIQAQGLYSSSKLLWKTSKRRCLVDGLFLNKFTNFRIDHYQRASYLLIGLAIENLVKGIVIGRETPDKQDTLLSELSKNHDIRSALSKIPEKDRPKYSGKLVEKLERHIVWASKYPIPKKTSQYQGQLMRNDFAEIERLYLALLKIAFNDNAETIDNLF